LEFVRVGRDGRRHQPERRARQHANAAPGADLIQFAVNTGQQTIAPLSALPHVSGAVTMLGMPPA
jgi:hypothetical protein